MSILDRLTDEDLKALLELRDAQIQKLMKRINFLEDECDRLQRWSKAKTRRIAALTEDVAELKKGVIR